MNVLSLFDGMSCAQIALERCNITVDNYFSSEIKPHAIHVTQKNFPNTIQVGDINFITKETFGAHKIDLLVGGSPCQSFSRSGDNSGFDGKSGLFYEYIRLLKELRSLNPNIKFFLENVIMSKVWENEISSLLGVSPIKVNSKLVSAQNRNRLYWTNIEGFQMPIDLKITLKDILQNVSKIPIDNKGLIYFSEGEYRIKNATIKGFLPVNNYDSVSLDFPNSKTRRGRVAVQKVSTLTTSCSQALFLKGACYKLTPVECERLQNIPDDYTSSVSEYKRRDLIGDGWTIDVIVEFFKHLK